MHMVQRLQRQLKWIPQNTTNNPIDYSAETKVSNTSMTISTYNDNVAEKKVHSKEVTYVDSIYIDYNNTF